MSSHTNFDLTITRHGKINVTSDAGETQEDFSFDFINTTENIKTNLLNRKQLKEFGGRLYSVLFPNSVDQLFNNALTKSRLEKKYLRIRLIFESLEYASIPWEFLYYKPLDYFLAISSEITLFRYHRIPDKNEIIKSKYLNVLIIISSPNDQKIIDADSEKQIITTALNKIKDKGIFVDFDIIENATLKNISRQLGEKDYQVVHFIGHAGFENKIGQIALMNDHRNTRLIDEQTFDSLFLGKREIKLIILNACNSATTLPTFEAFSGIATNLIKRSVPAVIAMQFAISDKIALLFAEEFYYYFAKGMPIDQIIQATRRLIAMEENFSTKDFAIPVLFMRSENGIICDFSDILSTSQPNESNEEVLDKIFPASYEDYNNKLENLEFINRHVELNQLILNPAGPQFLEFYGTAGFGKTCLINKAIEYYKTQSGTVYAYIDFNKPELRFEAESILDEMSTQIIAQIPSVSKHEYSLKIIESILKQHKQIKSFILFFDSTEFISDDLMVWVINDFIPNIKRKLEESLIFFKIIFCGKYQNTDLKQYHPDFKIEHIQLSPFEEKTIIEMIKSSASIVGSTLNEKELKDIAEGILEITNGHPKCTKQLIIKMASSHFKNAEILFKEKKEIFKSTLNLVESEIIGENTIKRLSRDIKHLLDPLCVFRRFLYGSYTIQPLIDAGFIKEPLYTSSEIVERLVQIAVVHWHSRMCTIDPFIRKTLSMKLQLFYPDLFIEITNFAIKLYDNWIIGKDSLGNDYPIKSKDENQIDFIVENLYHRAKLLDVQDRNSLDDFKYLKDKLKQYRLHLRSDYGQSQIRINLQNLKAQLLDDIELQKLIYKLFQSSIRDFFPVLE